MDGAGGQRQQRRMWATVAGLAAVIAVMVTLVAFSVPLYRLFCAATGFGGTTQRAASADAPISDKSVTVRFETEVAPGLPWRFRPEQAEVKVRLGEEALVFFSAENLSDRPLVGHATFNVTPAETGVYFNKVQCFCFSEERLAPHEKVDMPVDFFVDPKYADDPATKDIGTITLSYTFFRSADPRGAEDLSRFVASPDPDPQRGGALFAQRCIACHTLDRNKTGPRLAGVVGRRAGTVGGFAYSPALREAGIDWSPEALNRWLAGPQQMVPGARMPIRVPDATMRRDIIAYLEAQSHPAAAQRAAKAERGAAGQD